jgi:alkylation response protein AidB-like acyl-CoA dehydrogenase
VSSTLDNVRDLADLIAARAADIEADRALPPDVLTGLVDAGVFRMYVPRSHGGDELTPLDAVKVVMEVARADASVGWLAAIGANTPAIFAFLPTATYDYLYRDSPDVISAASLIPRGTALPDEGGYRFTGQWPFASGCRHASYLAFNALVASESGPPSMRMGVVPAGAVDIIDTWNVSGLRGTGSHDLTGQDLFVAEEWTASLRTLPAVIRHPLDGAHPLGRLGLELAAVAVGTARGALDDLIAIASTKRPLGGLGKPLSQDAVFQHTIGQLDLELRMAGTLLEDLARRDWQRVTAGGVLDQRTMLERRTLIGRLGEMAVAVVDGAYHAGGTTGLFESHPLQRRLRDIHAVAQHVTFTRDALTPAGGLLLGETVQDVSLF